MEKSVVPIVKRSLFSWILPGNMKLQILLVFIISVTVFARVFPLEMQKRIINEAISLRKTKLLFVYCTLFLAAVLLSSGLKYVTNLIHTLISQRVLSNMRKELHSHILTLPISFFRKTGPGLVVSSIVTELAPAGEFVGTAVATPVTSGLTLLAFAIYLFQLNEWLALLSFCIYPILVFILPVLQKRSNLANKKRVDQTRIMSNKITESISGIHEIHGNGSYQIENEKFNKMSDQISYTRFIWSMYKQSVKVVNNFFNNIGPFLIFLLGGYLTINGRLELGALVAFLSAQEKLYNPWGELIDFYQLYQEARVGYKKTMDYFDIEPEFILRPSDRDTYKLKGDLEIKGLSFQTEEGIKLIDDINLSLKHGETLALVGFSGSGKSTLAQCIGQLYKYTGGNLLLGSKEVAELTKADVVHNIGYVAQAPYIFDGTIEENILYSCVSQTREGGEGDESLPNRDEIIEVIQKTGLFSDILQFGLNTYLNMAIHKDLAARILRVRKNFQKEFDELLSGQVEFFKEDVYLYYSDVYENIVFGSSNNEEFKNDNLLQNHFFIEFLNVSGLIGPLLNLGDELSRYAVDIHLDLPPEEIFFEQSPLMPEELEKYKELVKRRENIKLNQLSFQDQRDLLKLALRFTPGIHKLVSLSSELEGLIIRGRSLFRKMIMDKVPGAILFFNTTEYIQSQTILNNILFGKINTEKSEILEKIKESISQCLIEEDLLESIIEMGMQFQVGTKGDRLSGGQRQKLAIARIFLKSPNVLIMDEATSGLDNRSQARIQKQIETRWKGRSTVIVVAHRLDIVKDFDMVAVLKSGKIVEKGTYDELIEKKGMLYDLALGKA